MLSPFFHLYYHTLICKGIWCIRYIMFVHNKLLHRYSIHESSTVFLENTKYCISSYWTLIVVRLVMKEFITAPQYSYKIKYCMSSCLILLVLRLVMKEFITVPQYSYKIKYCLSSYFTLIVLRWVMVDHSSQLITIST